MNCLAARLVKMIFLSVLILFKFPGRVCVNLSYQKRSIFEFQDPIKELMPWPQIRSSSSQLNISVCELEFYCELELSHRITGLNYKVKLNRWGKVVTSEWWYLKYLKNTWIPEKNWHRIGRKLRKILQHFQWTVAYFGRKMKRRAVIPEKLKFHSMIWLTCDNCSACE